MSWRTASRPVLGAARCIRHSSTSAPSKPAKSVRFIRRVRRRVPEEPWTGPSQKALEEDLLDDPREYVLYGSKRPGMNRVFEMEDLQEFKYDDTTSIGHRYLEQQRRTLHYMRLIEHEMPKLVAFRKPFVPPTSDTPVIVRSITYGGEEHPATAKRVIVAQIANLPLRNEDAMHKFCVLAGVRWSPEPPKDSGFRYEEEGGRHGYIKISCEDFPESAQNLKWASDTLDRLIEEANNLTDPMSDIPIDTRHIEAKSIKAGIGLKLHDYANGRRRRASAPSIKDFPKSWLPQLPPSTQ